MLERERIVTRSKSHPAHVAFDHLRTRMLRALEENGWNRIAITSPTRDCGKTMVSANLAFSLARQPAGRTMLLDMALRAPTIVHRLGIAEHHRILDFLTGAEVAQNFLRRVGQNLALGLNHENVRDSAELMQSQHVARVLAEMLATYRPNVVIYDLPPMLAGDDVIAFMPNVDAVLLVAASGQTKPAEIAECERAINEHSQFLGILLNKSTEATAASYKYAYE
jgi:Mrp family chromosome partitioning ATPase